MTEKSKLYYLKWTSGCLVYVKQESIAKKNGRRAKFTFNRAMEIISDPIYKTNIGCMLEIHDIDQKYEDEIDELERLELIRREFEIDSRQIELF